MVRVPAWGRYGVVGYWFCDDIDGPWVSIEKWVLSSNGKGLSYIVLSNEGRKNMPRLRASRVIAERMLGRQLLSAEDAHHIDGNTLNNCRSNLEVKLKGAHTADHQVAKGTPGGRGVYWDSRRNRWVSYVKRDRKPYFLGYFNTEQEASEAHESARQRLDKGLPPK